MDFEVLIIPGRQFLAIGRALIDVEHGDLTFRLNNKEVKFSIYIVIKRPKEVAVMSIIDIEDDCLIEIPLEEKM